MNIETVRRISLARHLYELGRASLRSKNDIYLFSAVNLLQDSVEAFLIAVAEHVNAAVDQNTRFDKYFILINEKIALKELPFKSALLRLNRIRVDSKHYGIQPARDECDRLSVSVQEFFGEVSSSIFGVSFSSVSAIDLLNDGKTKSVLLEAKAALDANDRESCAIACRKALYYEIEHHYDIAMFKDGEPQNVFAALASSAPYFTRNKDYIEKNVKCPTDYIVYDHDHLNRDLLQQGIDYTAFWNVWRLTPEVYKGEGDDWFVKYDFDKLDKELLSDKIEYIFSTTVDIILVIHTTREAIKTQGYGRFHLVLAHENVPVYEKADKNSKVIGTTPPGLLELETDYRIEGFQRDGVYWHVRHYTEDIVLNGFIRDELVRQP